MFQRIKDNLLKQTLDKNRTIAVSFTGGLGAQILSAAIYQHFRQYGRETYADFSYFSNEHRIAMPGTKGHISNWKWELASYGLARENFSDARQVAGKLRVLNDGALKFSLALEALRSAQVRATFDLLSNDLCSKTYRYTELSAQRYVCMHIRRGDYLNVASHLVGERSFDDLASKFRVAVDRLLILSDSPVDMKKLPLVENAFEGRINVIDDNPDPVLAHSLMRNATVLICSNSQFSLSAGLLSEGVVVIPKIWFGKDSIDINAAVDRVSEFSVLQR